jgi:hypothetical protein
MATDIAGLTASLNQGLGQLGALGVNVAGGGAAAAAGAAPAANAAAATPAVTPGVTYPGLLTPTGVQNEVQAQAILNGGAFLGLNTTSIAGRQVSVLKTSDGYKLQPPSGQDEIVKVENKMLRFDGKGKNLTNFDVADRESVAVDLDRRQGIATGISNLSRVVAGRQERLKNLSEALAQDSNETGATNQVDIQRLVMEQQVTENLSNMNKKIYDSVQAAIAPWLR